MDYLHPPRRLLVARRRPARDEERTFSDLPAVEHAGDTRFLLADDFLATFLPFVLAARPDIPALRRRVRQAFFAAALRFAETRFLAVLRAVRFLVAMIYDSVCNE